MKMCFYLVITLRIVIFNALRGKAWLFYLCQYTQIHAKDLVIGGYAVSVRRPSIDTCFFSCADHSRSTNESE